MFASIPRKRSCQASRTIQTHRIFPKNLNSFGALYGGHLMSLIDDAASISASRHCRRPTMTASTDSLDFLHPIYENDAVTIESYVSGAGYKSMEIFVKITGENTLTGETYLAATCFMTFVVVEAEDQFQGVPSVIPETTEEIMIHEGYQARRSHRLSQLKSNQSLAEYIVKNLPNQF